MNTYTKPFNEEFQYFKQNYTLRKLYLKDIFSNKNKGKLIFIIISILLPILGLSIYYWYNKYIGITMTLF